MELNLLMYLELEKRNSGDISDMIICSFMVTTFNQTHSQNPLLYDPVFNRFMENISMRERN